MSAISPKFEYLRNREADVSMSAAEFRRLGHRLIDRIAELLETLPSRKVTPGESPEEIRRLLDAARKLPAAGTAAEELLERTTSLLIDHSLFNGHPRFWGYVTASPTPIGILGELLAAAINPNVGGWILSPIASEIENQTVQWIAELVGYPTPCGGLLVSGGNMANMVGVWAARATCADWEVRKQGIASPDARQFRIYASTETHTWLQKSADLIGLGSDAISWIEVDHNRRLRPELLRRRIEADRQNGDTPWMVVGSAGTVSTGAIDPLDEISSLCREQKLWFHIDGAYGGFATALPELAAAYSGFADADSIALDPHKWLYAPLEAGCTLVRSREVLRNAFSYHPPYYHFDEEAINYFDCGPQNSRGFRSLKVWLALQQAGRAGYERMIRDDINLARALYELLQDSEDIEPLTNSLSITTFRYVPPDLRDRRADPDTLKYLNALNQRLLDEIELGGQAFVSQAVLDEVFALRLCVVNFRTTLGDIEALPEIVRRLGRKADREMRATTATA